MIAKHNPGLIENNSDSWRGQVYSMEIAASFSAASWGIRAIAIALESMIENISNDEIVKLAPSACQLWMAADNANWNKSQRAASQHLRKAVDAHARRGTAISDYATIYSLVDDVIIICNGRNPYDKKTMNLGLARAGINVPEKPLVNSRIVWGTLTASVSTALGTVFDGTEIPLLMELMSIQNPEIYDYTMSGITLASLAYVIYARYTDQKTRI